MPESLMRAIGHLSIACGVVVLRFAVFALTQVGFGSVFFGSLWVGVGGIMSGLNLILQSKGLLD
jgi:hypothetical protein